MACCYSGFGEVRDDMILDFVECFAGPKLIPSTSDDLLSLRPVARFLQDRICSMMPSGTKASGGMLSMPLASISASLLVRSNLNFRIPSIRDHVCHWLMRA